MSVSVEIASYNAGYHRGLNTEHSCEDVRSLFNDWIARDEEPVPPGADLCFGSFEDGFYDGIDDRIYYN